MLGTDGTNPSIAPRQCRQCEEWYPTCDFTLSKGKPINLCKSCIRERNKAYRLREPKAVFGKYLWRQFNHKSKTKPKPI